MERDYKPRSPIKKQSFKFEFETNTLQAKGVLIMATQAPTQGASSAAISSTVRWGRSGDSGSAFNGLSRGRARGAVRGGGGTRGGRGGRVGPSPKEGKPAEPQKQDNLPPTKQTTTTDVPLEKAQTPTTAKPKPPSRRTSRTITPAVAIESTSPVDTTSSPVSARPGNRRRRSQNGKPNVPPKINVPTPDDNLLRPNKPRLPQVPHSAPIKDTPPHLSPSVGMRNNIDALVERVRAVAMADNRPLTPGSHIDWAGDDDDSLPDLDDWGVSAAALRKKEAEVMSPILVDGLTPLPEPPGKNISPKSDLVKGSNDIPKEEKDTLQPPINNQGRRSPAPPSPRFSRPSNMNQQLMPPAKLRPNSTTASTSLKPLHPSLPPKPVLANDSSPSALKFRNGATLMRNPPIVEPPITISKNIDTPANPIVSLPSDTPQAVHIPKPLGEHDSAVVIKVDTTNSEEPETSPAEPSEVMLDISAPEEIGVSGSIHAPTPDTTKGFDLFDNASASEGLTASIHAPQALSDSASAPGSLSAHTLSNVAHNGPLTHTRAHTVGRPPSFPRNQQFPDQPARFSRSGHSSPRGGYNNAYHMRTHSTPPPGTTHRTPHSRPVITGDAISKLARTIGSVLPPKPNPVAASAE